MNLLFVSCVFSIATLGVTWAKITFSCKKFDKPVEESLFCMNNQLKKFFGKKTTNVACLSWGRITFDCKKYKKKPVEETLFCMDNQLKDFYGKNDQKSEDYQCCREYVQVICSNKTYKKCQNGTSQKRVKASRSCKPASELPCTKYDENDWGELDSSKTPGKTASKNKKPGGSPGTAATGSGGSAQNSAVGFALMPLLIFALVIVHFI